MIGPELPPDEVRRAAGSALWTFPSILLSSFVVAWGAECAQFYISQGLALALLAWIQVLPELEVEDTGAVPRAVLRLPSPWRGLGVVALFVAGGALLYFTAHPFLTSMIGLATTLGVSQFVFVQWVAPFLSEFPEFVTTSYWARSR